MITTRHGNQYSQEEWDSMMGNWEQETDEIFAGLERQDEIIKAGSLKLEAMGVTGNTFGIADHIFNNGTEGITFTSQEKREKVEAIAAWMASQ